MPVSLLDSQFATLEEPGVEEHPIVVSADARPADIVDLIMARLGI
jgi:gluconate kinase